MSNDDRIIELESRLAYQEYVIQELSDLVYAQQKQIQKLESTLQKMSSQIREMLDYQSSNEIPDEPPPHY
jgi:SlyX protein